MLALLVLTAAAPVFAAPPAYLVAASPKDCKQGLYPQPGGGPFSVFLFCDDASGVNIGLVNTSADAGPGSIDLGPTKEWGKWQVNNRFWQDPAWATDITSFAWSPDLKSLYVATEEVYGTGALYKLDLVERTFRALVPMPEWRLGTDAGYSTRIKALDRKTGDVSVELTFLDEASRSTKVRQAIVR